MGLLRSSNCLEWEDISKIKDDLKEMGVLQFIKVYKSAKSTFTGNFAWGDEIETMIVSKQGNSYKLLLCSELITEKLTEMKDPDSLYSLEFAGFMVETTPREPYNSMYLNLLNVEKNMKKRLCLMETMLSKIAPNGFPLLMTVFPNIGIGNAFFNEEPINFDRKCICSSTDLCDCLSVNFWKRAEELEYKYTKSYCFPDNAITNHNRFFSFVRNIINRRGKTVEGYIKIMEDESVKQKNVLPGPLTSNKNKENKEIEGILIDAMGQGMGCCCLQVTLQASEMREARLMYDLIGVLCPLLLRLTRATPIAQGKLLATETRWDMLVFSVDCRTDDERGINYERSGFNDPKTVNSKIQKSRFSSIDMFISENSMNLKEYNDINPPLNVEAYDKLKKHGVDELMAQHISSLFIRDPILVYEDTLKKIKKEQNVEFNTDEFENIQSSNWRSMRFKLPALNGDKKQMGWKIEVRPMEIQPTVYENAAMCIFVVLCSRAIISYDINFYIPISFVDENFRRANLLNRKKSEYFKKLAPDNMKFFYRKNIFEKGTAKIEEGTMQEIFCGKEDYVGIIPLIVKFIREFLEGNKELLGYVEFVKKKIVNEYLSVSDWIRKFVINHPDYKNDSFVPQKIVDDLIGKMKEIYDKNDPSYSINE